MNKIRSAIYIGILLLLFAGIIFDHFQGDLVAQALANVPLLKQFVSVSMPQAPASTTPFAVTGTSTTVIVSTSTPSDPTKSNSITATDIITLTNMERATVANLPPLKENVLLDAAAETKLKNLFDEQYFAHISPSGVGPGDLAIQAGYNYIVEGENLAEGDFISAQELMDAWMASPGHRANILNVRYMDIGVAVGRGMYQGREVWMAVQEFGKPLSSCPVISSVLRQSIIASQTEASKLSQQLDTIKQTLLTTATGTPEENSVYNQIAQHYNNDVGTYNIVVTRLKSDITVYNQEVESFNACVNG